MRRCVPRAARAPGELPPYLTRRTMSVRAYDAEHPMMAGEVWAGESLRGPIERLLADERVATVHLHHAGRGCFSCSV